MATVDFVAFGAGESRTCHFDDALRYLDEAMTAIQTTEERWCEAEVFRTAGQITLKVPKSDAQQAERLFEHALAIARKQQAKILRGDRETKPTRKNPARFGANRRVRGNLR